MTPCGDGTSTPYTARRSRMCRLRGWSPRAWSDDTSRRRHRSRHRMTMTNDKLLREVRDLLCC